MKAKLFLVTLEDRTALSATLTDGIVEVHPTVPLGSRHYGVMVRVIADKLYVTEGAIGSKNLPITSKFDLSDVDTILVHGSKNHHNEIYNLTHVDSVLIGGAGTDMIYGGLSTNVIDGGGGRDNIYLNGGTSYLMGSGDDVRWVQNYATVFAYGDRVTALATFPPPNIMITSGLRYLYQNSPQS